MAELQRFLSSAPSVRVEETPVCTVCSVGGELDASAAQAIRDSLRAIVGERRVLIDLCGASFIDSAGLGALIGGVRRVRESGGEVAVGCSRPTIAKLLMTTGFDRIVTVSESLEEAEDALVSPPA